MQYRASDFKDAVLAVEPWTRPVLRSTALTAEECAELRAFPDRAAALGARLKAAGRL